MADHDFLIELGELGLALLVLIIGWRLTQKGAAKRRIELEQALQSFDGFRSSKTLIGSDKNSGLAIDEESRRILVVMRHTRESATSRAQALRADGADASLVLQAMRQETGLASHVYEWRDILACDVLEDGETVTRTSRTSQLGGALLGGLVFGPFGALVGALSGKTASQGTVKRVELAVTVNDTSQPVHRVALLSLGHQISKNSAAYKAVMERAKNWSATIAIIIRQADAEDEAHAGGARPSATVGQTSAPASVADEIRKLSALRDDGLLTDEQFEAQKRRLLARG